MALLRAFRAALDTLGVPGRVLAIDGSPLSAAAWDADQSFPVPRCTEPGFIPEVLRLCREHDIRLVVPTIDTELPAYALARPEFEAAGIQVCVSSPEVVEICEDKVLTHAWLIRSGLPTVGQATVEQVRAEPERWPFPLVVKPRRGSGSIGVRVVASGEELAVASAGGDCVVQTVAPGREHTVDVLAARDGRFLCGVPRRRIEVRAGEVSKGVTVRSAPLIDLARRVTEALPGAAGPVTIQVFVDPDTGAMVVIELNSRFGGGFPRANQAGAHYPQWLLEEVLGLPSTASSDGWREGLVMLRYDDAVFVDAAQVGL